MLKDMKLFSRNTPIYRAFKIIIARVSIFSMNSFAALVILSSLEITFAEIRQRYGFTTRANGIARTVRSFFKT
jgi:hypothetical protein